MRVVHYLNQFYGRIGGEEAADTPVRVVAGPVGPGVPLQQLLEAAGAELVATVICGDNFATEQSDFFNKAIEQALHDACPDVVIAGPAFNAGRYGLACGEVCRLATGSLGVPAVTALYPENPAVALYRRDVVIVPTTTISSGMSVALRKLADLALRLPRGESLGAPWDDG
jgi:betaine reductase